MTRQPPVNKPPKRHRRDRAKDAQSTHNTMLVTKNANRPVTWCTLKSVSEMLTVPYHIIKSAPFFFSMQMPFHKQLETCSAVPKNRSFWFWTTRKENRMWATSKKAAEVKKTSEMELDWKWNRVRKLQCFSWQSMPFKGNALVENSRWARKNIWCKGFQMEGTIDSSWIASLYSMQKKVCCLQLVA